MCTAGRFCYDAPLNILPASMLSFVFLFSFDELNLVASVEVFSSQFDFLEHVECYHQWPKYFIRGDIAP